jgi:H+/Cl- antiporter ClcA
MKATGLMALIHRVSVSWDSWFIQRIVVLTLAHVAMLTLMHVLLERYQPEPSGLRFRNIKVLVSFVLLTTPPAAVGMASATRVGLALIALIHASSPLLAGHTMSDPSQDLNFVYLWWWIPVPLVVGLVAGADILVERQRRPEVQREGD